MVFSEFWTFCLHPAMIWESSDIIITARGVISSRLFSSEGHISIVAPLTWVEEYTYRCFLDWIPLHDPLAPKKQISYALAE